MVAEDHPAAHAVNPMEKIRWPVRIVLERTGHGPLTTSDVWGHTSGLTRFSQSIAARQRKRIYLGRRIRDTGPARPCGGCE